MKTLKVHVIWACLTVVTASAWGKWVLHTREAEPVQRVDLFPRKSLPLTAALTPPALPPDAAPVSAAAAPAAAPPPVDEKPVYEVPDWENLSLAEIRTLIRSAERGDVWKAHQAVSRMVKGPLKTELIRELLTCKEAGIRQNALHLLRDSIGAESAAPILQEFLRTDPSVRVRESAAELIGRSEAPGNVEALLQAFGKDELTVQIVCAGMLSDLGNAAPAAQLLPRLAPSLESPDGAVRREAVERLSRLRCPQVLPLLARALRDSNGDVREEAINGLWDHEDAGIASWLEPLLQDPVPSVRASAKDLVDYLKRPKE